MSSLLWALFLYLKLIVKAIVVGLSCLSSPSISLYETILLVTSIIAAVAGVDVLLRKILEWKLKVEYWITQNPAKVNELFEQVHTSNACIKANSLELIYFKIRNKGKLILSDSRIWMDFEPRGFIILDDDEVNALPAGTALGTLQEEVGCYPLLHRDKPPIYKNLMWGRPPKLLMPHIAFYDLVTVLAGDDVFIPLWVKTPEKKGTYTVEITFKPRNLGRVLRKGKLTLHVQ